MSKSTINKILSVGIALMLWMYVITVVNPPTSKTLYVPVQINGIDDLTERGLALAGDHDFTAILDVEGTKSLFSSLSANDFEATINVAGSTLGERECEIKVTSPDGVRSAVLRYPTVTVTVDDLVEVSKPIIVEVTGTADNQEHGNVSLQPDSMIVTGAKSDVDMVHHIRVKVAASRLSDTDVTSVNESAEPVDSKDNIVSNVSLSSQYVRVTARLFTVKEVALKVNVTGEIPAGYELDNITASETIFIKGPKATLDRITVVETHPIDLSAVTTNSTIRLTPILEPGVELSSANNGLTAYIALTDMLSVPFTFGSSEINIRGLDGNYWAYIEAADIVVTVSGKESALSSMVKDDIDLYIDLSSANTETVTAVLQAKTDLEFNTITIEPEEVEITINESPVEKEEDPGEEISSGDVTSDN